MRYIPDQGRIVWSASDLKATAECEFAWLRAIRDRFGVEVRFPLVEDPSMAIGHAFGMLAPGDSDSATVRSLFFIDPRGVVRATTCYPANVGRSISEMLRTLDALGRRLDPGQVVITGSLCGVPWFDKGTEVNTRIEGLGTAAVTID